MIKLTMFSSCDLRQAALVSVLLGSLSLTPAFAVELVGKPIAVSSSSISANISGDEANEAASEPATNAPRNELAPHDAEPAAIENHSAEPFAMEVDKHFPAIDRHVLIPLMAICFGIGGPVLLIIVLVAMHYRAKDRRAKNINANIERLLAAGRDIPLELLRGDEPYVGDESTLPRDDVNLHKGIKNVCLGLGLLVCLTVMFSIEFGAIGFIVLSVGFSQLWLWKLSGRKKNSVNPLG